MRERIPKGRKRKSVFIRMAAMLTPVFCLLLLSQPALAQNTYVITDGDRVLYHTSYATDPAAVLNEAGLALDADDTYTTTNGSGVSEIKVHRGQQVTVDHCGQYMNVSTAGETVEQLLLRLGIPVDGQTSVSASLKEKTYDGMRLTVSRTVAAVETYTVAIPHEVVECRDDSLPLGERVVLTKGVDGQMLCTANVTYTNGEEISRAVIRQTVLQQPVTEVVAVGTDVPEDLSGQLVLGDGFIVTPEGETLFYSDELQVKATAYTHTDPGCNTVTSTGTIVRYGTVAVDPRVIPYGTRLFIVSNDGKFVYGLATAEDCGGSIRQNRIDLYFPTKEECLLFGYRDCTVYILGSGKTAQVE